MRRFPFRLHLLHTKLREEFVAWLWGEGFNLVFGTARRALEVGLAVPVILGTAAIDHSESERAPVQPPVLVTPDAPSRSSPYLLGQRKS